MRRKTVALLLAVAVLATVIGVVFSADPDSNLDSVGNLTVTGEAGAATAPALDSEGNLTGAGEAAQATAAARSAIGEVVNSFPNPATIRGLTFRGQKLWGLNSSGILHEMDPDTGAVISTLPTTSGFGLGFDASRAVFVVADAAADVIRKVSTTSGAVVGSFPSPGAGPIGAAWDPGRDGYWISDFKTNTIDLVNPGSGAVMKTCAVPVGASRIAGTGYTADGDVILFHSRDNATSYMIRGGDCSLVGSFPTPPGPGLNNGQGAAIRPGGLEGYLTNFDVATIFAVDLGLGAPPCTLDLALSYAAGTLTMGFTVGNLEPVTGSAWLVSQTSANLLGSIALAINDPPISLSFPIPLIQQETVGVLSTLTTPSEGIACSTWVTIDTGPA